MNLLVVHAGWIFALSLALSCASASPLYTGDRRPRDEVGVLKMATNGAITKIGDHKLEGRAYELLPGDYSIEFRVILPLDEIDPGLRGLRRTGRCKSRVVIQAAREYQIVRSKPRSPLVASGERQRAGEGTTTYFHFSVEVVEVDLDGKPISSEEVRCSW